jgi:glycosyltransferase involved in cell wall biosynthesis
MNILIVNDSGHVNGGVAQVALGSAAGLAERGHGVVVLAAEADPAQPAIAAKFRTVSTNQQEIASDAHRLRAAMQGLWNLKAQHTMRALLDAFEPADTIVHLHGWTKALSCSVVSEVLRRQYPVVTTLHEYFSACPNGGFFNYQTLTSCPLVPLSLACISTHCDSRGYPEKLWRVARQVLQHRAAGFPEKTRHFITVSRFSEEILKPYLPGDAVIHPVRNPINVKRGDPAAVDRNTGFICVGRLSPEKGGVLLAKAAASLNVPVSFVGDGMMRQEILDACPAARMPGWLPGEQVLAELRSARALVLPSLWYETQGLVVGEAAALGVPAIVPRESAASEFVVDGVTGLLFQSGSEEDLRKKMAILHGAPRLAAQMGAAAYEHYWSDPPTLERHVDALEGVYRSVIAQRATLAGHS